MKNKLYLFILFLLPLTTLGQAGMWTWIKGDSTVSPTGHYGIQGMADSLNTPPGVYEPCEWTDQQGNFWLFGGVDDSSNVWGDLWKYDVKANNWTWMKGTGYVNDTGSYGTIGVSNINNRPSARGYGVATWVDLNGTLWLFSGGRGNNDLWKYNIDSNIWTWVNGSPKDSPFVAPSYGTKGVPSSQNTPGYRGECSATWVDASNDLWLFGGIALDTSLGDLWRYNIATNEWTWMSGSSLDSTNQTPTYGIEGIEGINNYPGDRWGYCSWKSSDNKFWLMGGLGAYLGGGVLNDMWRYDPSNNEWAWMSGTSQPNDNGNYGSLCSSSENFSPSSRFENRARWTDNCGNFWMYGGARDYSFDTSYSDLWLFNSSTLYWTLVSGSSSPNIIPLYNTKNISSVSSQPGGRSGSVAWKSKNGDLYLFGGFVANNLSNYQTCNDLWKYTIDTSCTGSCGTEGIEKVPSNNSITIYPNPTASTVNIILSQPCNNCLLIITDITGRQLVAPPKSSPRGGLIQLDMSGYASGLYFITIQTANEIKTVKVVKE